MASSRRQVIQPFSRKPKRSLAVAGQRQPRPTLLQDYTGIVELTQNVGLQTTGDYIAWCDSLAKFHDQYMLDRERIPEIKTQSGKNVLFPYLEGMSESAKSALLTGPADDSVPIEYTVRLLLQIYEHSKNSRVKLGPLRRDLASERWHRIWQTVKYLTKAKTTRDRGKPQNRWEIARTRESQSVPPLWWMNDDEPDETLATQQDDDGQPDGDFIFRPPKWYIYWENWETYQHISECPDAVQPLPDPIDFSTPQGFRDQLRAVYRMPEMGMNINRVMMQVTPAIPFAVGPPTQTISIRDNWMQVITHCTNESPDAIKWRLVTRAAAEAEPMFELTIPHRLRNLIGQKPNGELYARNEITRESNSADEVDEEQPGEGVEGNPDRTANDDSGNADAVR